MSRGRLPSASVRLRAAERPCGSHS